MKDIENSKKESPMLGLTGMGGGVASLMWHHAAAGIIKGQLWAWGRSHYGELMKNNEIDYSSPVQVGTDTNWKLVIDAGNAGNYVSFAAKDDGTLWTSGYAALGGLNQPGFPPTASNKSSPTQLPGSWSGAMARTTGTIVASKLDGTLWTWGANTYGMLGLNQAYGPGAKKNRSSPCQVGTDTTWSITEGGIGCASEFMMAVKQDGTLWGWGNNDNTGLMQPGTYRRSSPVQLGTSTNWLSINIGGGGSSGGNIATKTDGTMWGWGTNSAGMLGQNGPGPTSSPRQVGTETTWAGLSLGGNAVLATKTDGTLWSWGNGTNGKLGHNQPANTDLSSPKQVGYESNWKMNHNSVGTINVSVAAVKQDGTLWAWGTNDTGQLGLNGNLSTTYSSPVQVGTATNWLAVGGISSPGKNFFGLRK